MEVRGSRTKRKMPRSNERAGKSGDPEFSLGVDARLPLRQCVLCMGHIKLKYSRNGYEGLRTIAVFEANISKRLCTIYEQTAAGSALVSCHPIAAPVSTNHENGRTQARGRFNLVFHRI